MRGSFPSLALALSLAAPAAAQTLAIRAGNLIDPATGVVAKDAIILVKEKRIIEVGPRVAIPEGAEVVDLSGEWVMPGVMDVHTHITWGVPKWHELGYDYLDRGSATRAFIGLRTAQTLLQAGITTVRDVGNDGNYAAVDLRKAIDAGWFVGPTIQTAGKIIAPYGGQDPDVPWEMGTYWQYDYVDADGPEELRKAIRKNIYYGADLIKLVADSNDYHYSIDELKAAVEEAHHAHRAIAVHVFGGEAADNVIAARVDSIEHAFDFTDAQLRATREKGIILVATEFPEAHLAQAGVETAKEDARKYLELLRRAHGIGVRLAFGTDIVIDLEKETRADMTWDYLARWRAAGVSDAEILKAMTATPAALLRIEKERGAIAVGFFADIIAMPASPLADVEALRGVDFVMKNGAIVRRPKASR